MEFKETTTNNQAQDTATNYNEISYGLNRLAASPLTPILEEYRKRTEAHGRIRSGSEEPSN